jgi:hypothetical protein
MGAQDINLEVSEGAVELLRVAGENDTHGALANNGALVAVLQTAEAMLRVCRDPRPEELVRLLGEGVAPKSFLELVVACLTHARRELNEQYGAERKQSVYANLPLVSDFDKHAFQGFAEALADTIWPKRAAKEFDGPPLVECLSRLANCERWELCERIIQNYLANIMQYYFAAARLREKMPDLDPQIEVNLRLHDAHAIASRVTARLSQKVATIGPRELLAAVRTELCNLAGDRTP